VIATIILVTTYALIVTIILFRVISVLLMYKRGLDKIINTIKGKGYEE